LKKQLDNNKDKRNKIIFLSLIIILTIITFSNSFFNEFISYDDPEYIIDNYLIRGLSFQNLHLIFSSYVMGNYHPMVILSEAIIFHFFKLNPVSYHAFSLFIHLLNVILVFNLTSLLVSKPPATKLLPASSFQLPASALVACLFAVHPMHCETVCWASDLKDLLFTFFFLASLIFYIKYLKSKVNSPQSTNKIQNSTFNIQHSTFYIISLFLFVCSCLSKSAAVTLPLIMILIDYFIKRNINIRTILEKAPFFLLSIVFGMINIYSQASADAYFNLSNLSLSDKVLFPIYNLSYYIISSLIPYKLSAIHPYPEITNNHLPIDYYILPVLIIIFTVSIIWMIIKQKDQRRFIIFGTAFFIINIALVLQIIPVGTSVVSERYTYLPYLGLFFIIGQYYFRMKSTKKRKYANIMIILILLIFSFISHERNKVWANSFNLYNDVLKKYPRSAEAFNDRANIKNAVGDKTGAMEDYSKAIEINPKVAGIFYNRGIIKNNLGDLQGSLDDYSKAIELVPQFANAYYSRGNTRYSLGDRKGALEDYNKTIELNPENPDVYNNRAIIKYDFGDYKGALNDYNKALELNPNHPETFNNRSNAKYAMGDKQGALEDYNKAIEINPQYAEAYNNRGNVIKYNLGDYKGAIDDFNKAVELNPQFANAFYNRGNAKYAIGDKEGACMDWKKSLELGYGFAYAVIYKYCK
jgi:protein O-mannosyl-transferase